jgi:hypothetical protein
MYYDVIKVSALPHMRLQITFRDGTSGEVKFYESHLQGVFEALKDPQIFMKASCDQGFVEWPGEIDLAPDAMYEEVRKNGVWELR